jgi:hypothetical protein
MKNNIQKNSIFMLLIPIFFISIMIVGLIPSATAINNNVREMFIYDECCSYIEESQSHLPTLLIFSSFLEDQIKK